MKKTFLFLFTLALTVNLFSQDIIVKKDGEELSAKVLKIGMDNVKFKKFGNLTGPDYIMPKYEILFIKFENGTKEIFKVEKSKSFENQSLRKGVHFGIHLTPSIGKLTGNKGNMKFAPNVGMDFNFYVNDFVGIKTGFEYQKVSFESVSNHNYNYSDFNSYTYTTKGSVSSIGIPFKLLVTSGKKIGFYMEAGLTAYFVLSTDVEQSGFSGYTELPHEPLYLAQEAVVGVNIMASEGLSFNIGVSNHYGLTKATKASYLYDEYSGTGERAVSFGVKLGMALKLNK